MADNRCVFCGSIIPEGLQVCPSCYRKLTEQMDENFEKPKGNDMTYKDGYLDCLLHTGMTANDYQELAARTIDPDMTPGEQEAHALHGMVGEIGELHSIYQKLYQGHDFDRDHAASELGDLLWFCAEWCTAHGITLESVMLQNIDKLLKRYPDGFEAERSLHRAEGDI